MRWWRWYQWGKALLLVNTASTLFGDTSAPSAVASALLPATIPGPLPGPRSLCSDRFYDICSLLIFERNSRRMPTDELVLWHAEDANVPSA